MAEYTEQIKIAVLAEKMEAMTTAFQKMENKLDSLTNQFVIQEQLTAVSNALRERIARTEKIVYGVMAFIGVEIGGLIFMAIQNSIFKK